MQTYIDLCLQNFIVVEEAIEISKMVIFVNLVGENLRVSIERKLSLVSRKLIDFLLQIWPFKFTSANNGILNLAFKNF